MVDQKMSDFSVTVGHRVAVREVKMNLSTNLPGSLPGVFPFKVSDVKVSWHGRTGTVIGSAKGCSIVGMIMVGSSDMEISIKLPTNLSEQMDLDTVKTNLRDCIAGFFPSLKST